MNDLLDRIAVTKMQESLKDRNGKPLRLRWNNATQIKRSLARVNNLVLNGALTPKQANSVYFSANLILKAIELEQQNGKSERKCAQKIEKENET